MNDPIALIVAERLKSGGHSNVISEADCKKRGIPLQKTFKLLSKGKEEVVLM
jgi:hypothetical protein